MICLIGRRSAGVSELLSGGGVGVDRPGLLPVVSPDRVPLSFAQLRLWFLAEFEGPSATYNIPLVLRLVGNLSREAFAAGLADVVGRHESLRTVFPVVDGRPYQSVLDPADVDLGFVARGCSRGEVGGLVEAAVGWKFDLASEIPVRVWLFEVTPDEHVLVLVLHHIASDGWSRSTLMRDLGVAYAARLEGRDPGWSSLPVQYADYAIWQRELLGSGEDGGVLAEQLSYWTAALEGLPEQLDLPFDRLRPAVSSYRGGSVELELSVACHERLLGLARGHDVTLFMVLQAAFAALLNRVGAGDDVPLGTVVAGRMDEALDDLVGFFVNTLVLRTDVSGNPAFGDLLSRVRAVDLAAYAQQDLPFEQLVVALNPVRSTARHPLFQVMIALNNTAVSPGPGFVGVESEPVEIEHRVSKFDLNLGLKERRDADGRPGRRGWCPGICHGPFH